jgi:translation initiation factor IF-2
MSEEIIRINKVLRELNISLERAVDYLKDKGITGSKSNTKISDDVYNVLCVSCW